MRTASIRLKVTPQQAARLSALRTAYADACNRLVPLVQETCSACGQLGTRLKHRFECSCGLRAHADLNASRNLARIGETAVSPRAVVNTPDVGRVACHASP